MTQIRNHSEALVKVQSMDAAQLEAVFGKMPAVSGKVVGALYNSDTDGMKNVLLHTDPAGIMTGLKIAAVLTGAAGAVLVVNCEVNEQELTANANMVSLPLEFERAETVNKMAHRNDRLFSLDELCAMAGKLTGEEAACLVAVDDGVPVYVSPETKLAELVPEGAKGVLTDHKFFAAAQLSELTVGELQSQSGVLHTVADSDCAVDLMRREIQTLRQKSCGKCVYCREGLYQLMQFAREATNGRAKPQSLDLAEEIADAMTVFCNCTLGDLAGMPLLTAAKNFAGELDAHIRRRECPTGVCLALTQIYIDPAKCVGCGTCATVCPAQCIEIRSGFVSVIESFDCTRCGKCFEICPNGAVVKTSGRAPKLPTKPTRVKGAKREAVVEEEKEERLGAKRKRSFGKTAAAGAPAQAAPAAEPKAEEPAEKAKSELKTVGKRKRVYAKPKSNNG